MRMPDANILIYAHRVDDQDHEFYRDWLENLVNGAEPFALSSLVAAAFVRIVTHSNFAAQSTTLPQALAVIESLRMANGCRWLQAGERHWNLFRRLTETAGTVGRKVADAQHAALALEHGCTWVTRDRDFRSFEAGGLRLEILEP